jgi:hypothetical protein
LSLDYLSIALNLGVSFRLVSTDSEHHLQSPQESILLMLKIDDAIAVFKGYGQEVRGR